MSRRLVTPALRFLKGPAPDERANSNPNDGDNGLVSITTTTSTNAPSTSVSVAGPDKRLAQHGRRKRSSSRWASIRKQFEEWEDEEVEREMRGQRLRDLEKAFHMYDVDGSGCISAKELRAVLRSLGHNPTDKSVNELMAQVDLDGSGNLDMAEFIRLMDVCFDFSACDPRSDLHSVFLLLENQNSFKSSIKGRVRVGDIREMVETFNMDETWTKKDTDSLLQKLSDDDLVDFEQFFNIVAGKINASL